MPTREPDDFISMPGDFFKGRVESFWYRGKGRPIFLETGKLYTRRKNTFPAAYVSADGSKITGVWSDLWSWIGSPPFMFTGETILQRTNGFLSPYTYFAFFHQRTKIWILKNELRYIKKFRMKNN